MQQVQSAAQSAVLGGLEPTVDGKKYSSSWTNNTGGNYRLNTNTTSSSSTLTTVVIYFFFHPKSLAGFLGLHCLHVTRNVEVRHYVLNCCNNKKK